MLTFVKYLVLGLLVARSSAQISFGGDDVTSPPVENSCTTPHQKAGICISLRECGSLLQLLKKPVPANHVTYLRSSVCGYSSFLPNICCPDEPPVFPIAVNGGWGAWAGWSSCSTTCGDGQQVRVRACDSPAPAEGGAPCEGAGQEQQPCKVAECRVPISLPGLDTCGESSVSTSRIVNGQKSKLNGWPWIAAVGYSNPDIPGSVDYLCGGTLITSRHVVTAMHCLIDGLTSVRLGELILGDDNDGASPEEVKVAKIIKNENYNGKSFDNDIAILELERDVAFRTGIKPICLTKDPELAKKFENTGLFIAGWGATSFKGPTSKTLLEGIIRPIPRDECQAKFSSFRNVAITPQKICARDLQDKVDACQGDSGGPLMAWELKGDGSPARFYLVGVVSFGYKCAAPGFPGVYTRVTEYVDWIQKGIS